MYRVELKVLMRRPMAKFNSLFLMYRVELKGKSLRTCSQFIAVPNVPCGVESFFNLQDELVSEIFSS